MASADRLAASTRRDRLEDDLDAHVVASLFRAATGAAAWGDALRPMADALRAHHHAIWLRSERDLYPLIVVADTTPPEVVAGYREHYCALDPLAPIGAGRPRGTVFTSDELVPFDTLQRTAYYNEFMAKNGMRRFIAAACALPCSDSFIAIAFQRPLGSDPFDERDRGRMAQFTSQVSAAVEVWSRMRAVQERARDLEAALEAADVGLGIADADGRMRFHNRQLALTFAQRDGLQLDAAGRLMASIACGLAPTVRTVAIQRIAASLEIPRPSGRRAYRLVVAPLEDERRAHRDVIIRVHDPDVGDRLLERRLCDRFALTPAEAEIAVLLARGYALERIALLTRRSIGTARNLLKRSFGKTATHRQAALVALVCAIEHDGA